MANSDLLRSIYYLLSEVELSLLGQPKKIFEIKFNNISVALFLLIIGTFFWLSI